MAIAKSISRLQTFTTFLQRLAVATNVGTVATTLPASGALTPTGSTGVIRVKSASIVATGTVQAGVITATDGTTTVTIMPQQVAGAANALLDLMVEFGTDLNLTSMSATVIAGTANSVHDFELGLNP